MTTSEKSKTTSVTASTRNGAGSAVAVVATTTNTNWRTCDGTLPPSQNGRNDNEALFPFDRQVNNGEHKAAEWSHTAYQDALTLYDQLMECQDSFVNLKIQESLKYLDGAYRLYGPEAVIGSYNGGKDAVAILHLMRAAHAHYYDTQITMRKDQESTTTSTCTSTPLLYKHRPRVIYFDHPKEFPEILDLLHHTTTQFDLDMLAFDCGVSFPNGLKLLVDTKNDGASQLAFVLGTRTSDPNAMRQGHFAPSSSYMPPFMRINPILDWNFGHVWHFLRLFQLPYCGLYDQGYTSLGNVDDTLPCPALLKKTPESQPAAAGGTGTGDNTDTSTHWPAYMLDDWDQERAGRLTKQQVAERRAVVADGATSVATTTNTQPQPPVPVPTVLLQPSISTLSVMDAANNGTNTTTTTNTDTNTSSTASTSAPLDDNDNENDSTSITGSTVGLLIIGDEILKGLCNDTNTFVAANALRHNGLLLNRVVVVPDEHDDIVQEIHRLNKEVDLIITSGGVGATHDDVTMRAVASALDWPLGFHEELGDFMKQKIMNSMEESEQQKEFVFSEAQRKIATLPKHGKLRFLGGPKECKFQVSHVCVCVCVAVGNIPAGLDVYSTTYWTVISFDGRRLFPRLNSYFICSK
jgi:molybdenum cofactor synthesis domain-containing protein